MKMDQIAYYCHDKSGAFRIKKFLGLENAEWIHDRVEAMSTFPYPNEPVSSIAHLQFNYDLGVELEILRYASGPSWHDKNPLGNLGIFQSHIGVHLDDGERFPSDLGFTLVQETFTVSHTSKYLTDPSSPGFGRRFHYRIHEISPGSYIKFIRRIHP